jgi:hypothetical protein
LLRARRKRPRGGRAAEQCDELATFHVDFALPLIASPDFAEPWGAREIFKRSAFFDAENPRVMME